MSKAEETYIPFPRSGLTKKFEPYIRKWVGEFCEKFPDDHLKGLTRILTTPYGGYLPFHALWRLFAF
jgi:hypothetical protein